MPVKEAGVQPGENGTELQTLVFDDVLAAIGYYRELGFLVNKHDGEGFVRIKGTTLRLRQAQPGESRRPRDGTPDATILVDRPYRLLRQICDRKAGHVLAGGVYGFGDYAGNVVAVGPTPGVAGAMQRLIWPPAVDELRTRWRIWRNSREEAPYLRAFQSFYRQLPDRRNIFYMFFSGGLLNWVAKSASHVPADVNLVLIGSALPDYEQQWIKENLRRPFFHIDLRVDDVTVWEFLFATNEHSFGWLDIDCLVFNGALFEEMSNVADGDYANGIWWIDSGLGFQVARTYFQFINIAAVQALRDAGFPADPNQYSFPPYPLHNRHVPGRRCYSKVVTRRLRRQLAKVLPADSSHRPVVGATGIYIPGRTSGFFDTTFMFQAMARTLGFEGHHVRQLGYAGHLGLDEASDDVLHVGHVSSARSSDVLHCVLANHVGMLGADRLPEPYLERRELVTAQLAKLGLTPESATEAIRQHLIGERNLSEQTVDTIMQPPLATLR